MDMTIPTTPRPIGPLVDAHSAKRPERVTLEGRWVTLAPLDPAAHAEALYEGSNGDEARESVWTYLFDGPYRSLDEFRATSSSRLAPPIRCSSLSSTTRRGDAVGYQTLMRIDAANRVIEVGNIMYTPAMQRTVGATEAQYLFAAMSSTSSAIAATNGSATTSTRHRGARRSASASRSRESFAST